MPVNYLPLLRLKLQRKLSINVAVLSENRVGKVIFGIKLCVVTKSKKSLKVALVLTFKISILKSPAMIVSGVLLFNFCKMGSSSL